MKRNKLLEDSIRSVGNYATGLRDLKKEYKGHSGPDGFNGRRNANSAQYQELAEKLVS